MNKNMISGGVGGESFLACYMTRMSIEQENDAWWWKKIFKPAWTVSFDGVLSFIVFQCILNVFFLYIIINVCIPLF